jgi:hypothetical protein
MSIGVSRKNTGGVLKLCISLPACICTAGVLIDSTMGVEAAYQALTAPCRLCGDLLKDHAGLFNVC